MNTMPTASESWKTAAQIITFDPMSPRDRRVVHMALREFTGVRTESIGEEPDRRIQIIPAAREQSGAPPES